MERKPLTLISAFKNFRFKNLVKLLIQILRLKTHKPNWEVRQSSS